MKEKTSKASNPARNRAKVIEKVFSKNYRTGAAEVLFTVDDIRDAIAEVRQENPSYREGNVFDVKYEFASGRQPLPEKIQTIGPWTITGRGKAKYAFVKLTSGTEIKIQDDLAFIYLPDATPEIVAEYAGNDEQGILAKVRYNRLLDIFLKIACYHLQNHWKTSIKNKGGCEIDDLYVGLSFSGKQFVIPVEAKCRGERLHKGQIMQMIDFARARYGGLILRPIGIQEMKDGSLTFLEFTPAERPDAIEIREIRKYKLVPMAEVPLQKQQSDP
jgi:hypothetical protein